MFSDDPPAPIGGHSPFSSQSHFSPRLLTPDIDSDHQHSHHPPMTVHSDGDEPDVSHAHGLSFAKQPIQHPVRVTSVKKGFPGARDVSSSSSRRTSSRGVGGADGALSDGSLSYALSAPRAMSIPRQKDGDSDTNSHRGSPTKNGQVSLLSAIMTSPEHGSVKGLCRPHTASVLVGESKPLLSNPSTALSSPTSTSAHGILRRTISHQTTDTDVPAQAEGMPHGILRRGSMSGTEAGLGPAFAHTHSNNTGMSVGTSKLLESKLIQADERRVTEKEGRIGWADDVFKSEATVVRAPSTTSTGRPALKFAMAPARAPSHGSTSASEAGEGSRRSSSSRRALSPFAREREAAPTIQQAEVDAEEASEDEDAEEEEEEDDASPPANLPGYLPRPGGLHIRPTQSADYDDESSESSDAGYEEDEEDGMFSSDDETSGRILDGLRPSAKFPFARSTNYWNRRKSRDDASPGASPPPPAPAFVLPPNRRGRGHIRVADQPLPRINTGTASGREGGCTRHCSPPPKSRSRINTGLEDEEEKGEVVGQDGTKSALYGRVQEAPPAAASPSARRMKRPFDLQKGKGKSKMAGSPMPPRVAGGEEEEDEEDEEDEQDGEESDSEVEEAVKVEGQEWRPSERTQREANANEVMSDHPSGSVAASYRSGWRSDDAAFYGPKARVSRPASRNVSESAQGGLATSAIASDLTSSVFSETEEEAVRAMDEGDGAGMTGFIRRASEHLPMFRRPSVNDPAVPYAQPPSRPIGKAREGSAQPAFRTPLSIAPSTVASPITPPQVTIGICQPMLDDTPAKAEHAPRAADGGLAHRLEQTLGTSHQLGVVSASMALQKPGSASSRPSTASRDSIPERAEVGGTAASGPYPQPRTTGSNRPSLSGQGTSAGPAPTILAAPPSAFPATVNSAAATGSAVTSQPVSALGRAPSLSSGKVTFAPAPVPAPRRAVSSAMGIEIVEEAKRRRDTRVADAAEAAHVPNLQHTKSAPIKCPKIMQTEDLGWTEGALLNIRKHVGKGEPGV